MGNIRARTGEEFAARKKEIIEAAKRQLSAMDYDDITLATIAKDTSMSRPSMYNYYKNKESIFVDIFIEEYLILEKDLHIFFKERLTREEFCRNLTDLLWERPLLLKLLSLQLPVWRKEYDNEIIDRFIKESLPYQQTLDEVLLYQFPQSTAASRNTFRVQFSIYCNSLYILDHLPNHMMNLLDEFVYEKIPSAKDMCCEGLMLLSAVLE